MSSGMNVEQAKEYAKHMTYSEAVANAKYSKGMRYRKATMIKLRELAEIADRLDNAPTIEPKILEDGTLVVKVKDGSKVGRVFVEGENHFCGLYYPDDDTEIIEAKAYAKGVVEERKRLLKAWEKPTVDKDYLIRLIQEAVYDGEACARLIDMVEPKEYDEGFKDGYNKGHKDGYAVAQAEAVMDNYDEPKQGEWKFSGNFGGLNKHECSICGKEEFRMSGYCPNCGAKMYTAESKATANNCD